jgi:phosphoadenosine phosphosulfate reductase
MLDRAGGEGTMESENMKPREFVEVYAIRSLVCCFSGGKDSLVATHYTLSQLEDVNIEKYVVFVDTTVMVPTAEPFVRDVCKRFNWNLYVLKPNRDFWTLVGVDGLPMPTMFRRWCCGKLKLDPIKKFLRGLNPQRGAIMGLRKEESQRRKTKLKKQVLYDQKSLSWKFSPILDWSEQDVFRYMKEHDLPMPPHYRLGIPETCLCGAYSSRKVMMRVKAQFPELFQKFVELEKQFKSGGSAFYFQNKPVYAKDLLKQKTLTEVWQEE